MRGRTTRSKTLWSLAGVGLTLLAACSSTVNTAANDGAGTSKYPPIPPGPIKLGLSLSLSGPYAEIGNSNEIAYTKVALPFFDKEYPDGIDGHKVVLDIQNDQGQSTTAVNVANEFAAQKIPIVIKATNLPGAVDLQLAIWNKNKIPVISYNVNEGIYADGEKWPYIFTELNNDQKAGAAAADWIAANPGIKRLAVLTDGVPADASWISYMTAELQARHSHAAIVKSETISPGAVDVTTQLSQLRAATPDLVLIALQLGFGPVWDGLHSMNWNPRVLSEEDAVYDGYNALGSLASTALFVTSDCLNPGTTVSSLPASMRELMGDYSKIETLNNMLIFAHSVSIELEMARYAIQKYHSTSPEAIKAAMESLDGSLLWNQFTYHFTPQDHAGAIGHSEQVCRLSPLSDATYRIPYAAAGTQH